METGFFELPNTPEGCLDAAILEEEKGKSTRAEFLLEYAEFLEEVVTICLLSCQEEEEE